MTFRGDPTSHFYLTQTSSDSHCLSTWPVLTDPDLSWPILASPALINPGPILVPRAVPIYRSSLKTSLNPPRIPVVWIGFIIILVLASVNFGWK